MSDELRPCPRCGKEPTAEWGIAYNDAQELVEALEIVIKARSNIEMHYAKKQARAALKKWRK